MVGSIALGLSALKTQGVLWWTDSFFQVPTICRVVGQSAGRMKPTWSEPLRRRNYPLLTGCHLFLATASSTCFVASIQWREIRPGGRRRRAIAEEAQERSLLRVLWAAIRVSFITVVTFHFDITTTCIAQGRAHENPALSLQVWSGAEAGRGNEGRVCTAERRNNAVLHAFEHVFQGEKGGFCSCSVRKVSAVKIIRRNK